MYKGPDQNVADQSRKLVERHHRISIRFSGEMYEAIPAVEHEESSCGRTL